MSSRTRTARATLSTTPTTTGARVSTATPWTCWPRTTQPPLATPRASSCVPNRAVQLSHSAPGLSLTIVGTGGVDGRQRSRRRGAGDAQAQEHIRAHHLAGLLLLQLRRAGVCLHGAAPARALHLPCETFPACCATLRYFRLTSAVLLTLLLRRQRHPDARQRRRRCKNTSQTDRGPEGHTILRRGRRAGAARQAAAAQLRGKGRDDR